MSGKRFLRKKSSSLLADMDASVLQSESAGVRTLFLQNFAHYQTFLVYLDYRREVQTGGIIADLLSLGRCVYVPVIDGDNMFCTAYYGADGADEQVMRTNKFGISEPVGTIYDIEKEIDMDVIVAPCVSCDTAGNRLGRGKGYYDKVLQSFGGVSVCLAYSFQVHHDDTLKIHSDPHDVAVTYVLTNKKIYGGLKPA